MALLACTGAGPAAREPATASDGRLAMGTVLEITLIGRDARALRQALDTLFAEAARLEGLLSVWDPASEVSRLNAAAGTAPAALAPELLELVARAAELTRLTRGAFDVTVGPLVSLWREAGARGELPSREALAAARARVGAGRVRVREDGRVALAAGSSVNLDGVAKGYALDRLASRLPAAGVEAALLDFGQSSVRAIGAPPGAPGWRLLARAPGGGFAGVLTLRDRALSVSGTFGSSVAIGGRRFGHVLDPRSGAPLEGESLALVVAPDAALAEALSKAVLVLGPREGLELVVSQPGCEALRLDAGGRAARTAGFDAAVAFEPLEPPSRVERGGAGRLKAPLRASDPTVVARELSCPVCNADFPLRGDERAGEEVYCTYCKAPCRLTRAAGDDACEVEEDF